MAKKVPISAKKCSALFCENRWTGTADVSFHEFPWRKASDSDRLKEWIKNVCRSGFVVNKTTNSKAVLCSAHFTEDCFKVTLEEKMEAMGMVVARTQRGKRLKSTAVPTIFSRKPPINDPKTRTSSCNLEEVPAFAFYHKQLQPGEVVILPHGSVPGDQAISNMSPPVSLSIFTFYYHMCLHTEPTNFYFLVGCMCTLCSLRQSSQPNSQISISLLLLCSVTMRMYCKRK